MGKMADTNSKMRGRKEFSECSVICMFFQVHAPKLRNWHQWRDCHDSHNSKLPLFQYNFKIRDNRHELYNAILPLFYHNFQIREDCLDLHDSMLPMFHHNFQIRNCGGGSLPRILQKERPIQKRDFHRSHGHHLLLDRIKHGHQRKSRCGMFSDLCPRLANLVIMINDDSSSCLRGFWKI